MAKPDERRASLPYAPLESYVCWLLRRDGFTPTRLLIADLLKINKETVRSMRIRGQLTPYRADFLAVTLGVHPSFIWGDAWWEACEIDADVDASLAERKRLATNARKRQQNRERKKERHAA
jgi:hypothetical protein